MVDTALLFGATNRTQIEIEMWDTIALESQIAHATHDPMQGEKKQSWYLYLKAFADVANQVNIIIISTKSVCVCLKLENTQKDFFNFKRFFFGCLSSFSLSFFLGCQIFKTR